MRKVIILLAILLLSSCASKPSRPKHHYDLVSVAVAIDLARNSYLKGCSDALVALKQSKGSFSICLDRANKYVDEGIESLFKMEQN